MAPHTTPCLCSSSHTKGDDNGLMVCVRPAVPRAGSNCGPGEGDQSSHRCALHPGFKAVDKAFPVTMVVTIVVPTPWTVLETTVQRGRDLLKVPDSPPQSGARRRHEEGSGGGKEGCPLAGLTRSRSPCPQKGIDAVVGSGLWES